MGPIGSNKGSGMFFTYIRREPGLRGSGFNPIPTPTAQENVETALVPLRVSIPQQRGRANADTDRPDEVAAR